MATFGNLSTGTTPTDDPSQNVIWVKALTTPASNGTLTSISVYGDILSGAPTLAVALYSDVAGAPSARLGQEVTTLGSFAAGFGIVTTTLSTPISISAGVQYWFGLLIPGAPGTGDANIHFDTASGTELFFQVGSSFPDPMSGATSDNTERWSVFGTYTPTGGVAGSGQLGKSLYVMP